MNHRIDALLDETSVSRMIARLLFLASASTFALAATPVVPERLPEPRYAKLRTESPFAVATAQEVKEEKIPWAQNLYVGSVAKFNEGGEEKDWVIIKDRTQPGTLIQLFGNDPNAEGYQLVKLEWSEDPKKTKASIKKGTEFATIEVDQAAFTSAAPVPQPQKQPVPPKQPGVPGGIPLPAGNNAIRPPTTINRPGTPSARPPVSIPRPTNLPPAVTQPQPQPNPGANSANPNTRQRIRVIPTNP